LYEFYSRCHATIERGLNVLPGLCHGAGLRRCVAGQALLEILPSECQGLEGFGKLWKILVEF
jgi:hypothetical protein